MPSNFFSSESFLGAAAVSLYPGRAHELTAVEVQGRSFDVLSIDGDIMARLPFADFLEESDADTTRRGAYLPSVSLESVGADGIGEVGWPAQQGAPWIDWRRFPSFEAFVAHARARSGRAFEKGHRKRNLLTRTYGPLRFEPLCTDAALVELCLDWKAAQYRLTGVPDVLALPGRRRLFRELFARGALLVSTLFAGDRPIAVHLGARHRARLLYWVPAYEPEARAGSPGVLLLEELMRWSYTAQDEQLDLLIGMEPYKRYYATDVRLVRPWGRAPLAQRLYAAVRPKLVAPLRAARPLYRRLQHLKRRAVERGLVKG